MSKIKSFFIGIFLLAIMFVAVILCVLIYRANDQSSVKSYIFQINNVASQRVGALQDINDMSAVELRNKLIKTYVAEYFKVIPNEPDVSNRPLLRNLSSKSAYEQWQKGEAKTIEQMSQKKMFRRVVHVTDADIATMNMPSGYDYYNADQAKEIFYEIHYYTETWTESNRMYVEPVYDSGTLRIEARFKPGIKKDIFMETKPGVYKNVSIQKYLKSGENPMGLFMFEVVNIEDGVNQ